MHKETCRSVCALHFGGRPEVVDAKAITRRKDVFRTPRVCDAIRVHDSPFQDARRESPVTDETKQDEKETRSNLCDETRGRFHATR